MTGLTTFIKPRGEAEQTFNVEHLPSRTNGRDQIYFYTPFGTYVILDVDGRPSTLHLVSGHWDEDSWNGRGDVEDHGTLIGTFADYRESQRQMLLDICRRFRDTPPKIDPRLSPWIDGDPNQTKAIAGRRG